MTDKMKDYVWVIEEGSYSDYHVVGVFSSRKNAQAVLDSLDIEYGDRPTISRWPLNPAVEELRAGMVPWYVLMLRDGTVERMEMRKPSTYQLAGHAHIWRRASAPAYQGKGIPDCLDATVWAKNQKHAAKIVNEHRTRMIAEGKWT